MSFEQNKPVVDDFNKNTQRDVREGVVAQKKLEEQIGNVENTGEIPIEEQIKELGRDGVVDDKLEEEINSITNPDRLNALATTTSNPEVQEIIAQRLEEIAIDKIVPLIESIDDKNDPTGKEVEDLIREAITRGIMDALQTVNIVQNDLEKKIKEANPVDDPQKIAELKERVDVVAEKLGAAIIT